MSNYLEERCRYCSGEEAIPLETDIGETWIVGNTLNNAYGECEIKFCPMCGLKLEEGC